MPGSVVSKEKDYREDGSYVLEIDWVGDAVDGTVPDTSLGRVEGYVTLGETKPGATAPTDNYGIKIENPLGVDIFGGNLLTRSSTLAQQALPKVGTTETSRPVSENLTFKLSDNSILSATGKVRLHIQK